MGIQAHIGWSYDSPTCKSIELALKKELTGLHQVTNGKRISKYDVETFKDIGKKFTELFLSRKISG